MLRTALLATLLAAPAALAQTPQPAPADTTRIVVMSTTDLHGWVLPWDYYADRPEPRYAMAKVATLVDSVRARHAHTLLLDAGDWFQGNPFAEYFARQDSLSRYPLLAAADRMRYAALVLGNHEFNFGIDLLNRRIAQTETPIIGANIYGHGTTEPAYVPYILRDLGGVRVGIVGLTTPGSAVWDRPRVEGRLDFGDGVEGAQRFVREVRDRGAEVVVILAHSGLEGETSYQGEGLGAENFGRMVAEQVPGVDLLVIGHTHRTTLEAIIGPDGREVGVVQAGRWADHLGIAELTVVRESPTDAARVVRQERRVHRTAHAEPHPAIVELASEGHEAVRAWMATPLATTPSPWPTDRARIEPSAAVGLIHTVQREATGAQLSAAAAFSTAVTLGPEAITLGQLTQLYPYENALYVVEISGRDLRAFLEHGAQFYLSPETPGLPARTNPRWPGYNFDMVAGAEYELDLTRPVGERVTRLEVDGRAVRADDTFTMAVNSYRAEGGGGFPGMGDARVIRRIDRPVRDLIADWLRERGTVAPEDVLERNWRLSPEPRGSVTR
jgi:2',3'-cyclic-nucleotide 2'-phosphodiesterase (5'-nucleotidase family)